MRARCSFSGQASVKPDGAESASRIPRKCCEKLSKSARAQQTSDIDNIIGAAWLLAASPCIAAAQAATRAFCLVLQREIAPLPWSSAPAAAVPLRLSS
jgi:hypothetical protein